MFEVILCFFKDVSKKMSILLNLIIELVNFKNKIDTIYMKFSTGGNRFCPRLTLRCLFKQGTINSL